VSEPQLADPRAVYKRLPTLQAGGTRSISPFYHMNFSSSLLTQLKRMFIVNIKPLDVELLPLRRGLNQNRS
jgi:hypothetical protein